MFGKSILLFFFIALNKYVAAQDQDFSPLNVEIEGITKQLLGQLNGSIVVWEGTTNNPDIAFYDTTDLHMINSASLVIPDNVDEVTVVEKVIIIGNTLKVVVLGHSADNTHYSFHVFDCNEKGIIDSSRVTIPILNLGFVKRAFVIVKTNQKQDCLLLGWISTDKKQTSRNVEFSLLDEHSKVFHSRNHLEWSEFDRHVYKWCDLEVTNRRQVLIEVTRQEKIKKVYREMLIVRAFSSNEQKDPVVSSLTLPKGTYCGQWFISEDDRYCRFFITCLLNGKMGQTLGITGIYMASVSNDGSLTDIKYSLYSQKTRLKTIAHSPDPNELVSYQYLITHALFDAAGNTYLLQERRKVTEVKGLFSNTTIGYNWYYGSVLVSKFAPDGTFLWDNLVAKSQLFYLDGSSLYPSPKRQQEGMMDISYDDERFMSYSASLENDQLKLVFNDIPENCDWDKKKKDRDYYKIPGLGIPFVVSVSPEDGSHTYQCYQDLPYEFQYALKYNGYLYVPYSVKEFLNANKSIYYLAKVRF